MKHTVIVNKKRSQHKAKQISETTNTVNINLTLCGCYFWSWNEMHNYYKREKITTKNKPKSCRKQGKCYTKLEKN